MTCVIPDMDPTRPGDDRPAQGRRRRSEQFGVTNLFGSPGGDPAAGDWHRADDPARDGERDAAHASRRVISAGRPGAGWPCHRARSCRLLPAAAEVFTPYGATEALPVANIGSHEILGETRQL